MRIFCSLFLVCLLTSNGMAVEFDIITDIAEELAKFNHFPTEREFHLRVGNILIREAIERQQPIKLKDTKFNKEEVKNFKFVGLDVGANRLLFEFDFQKTSYTETLVDKLINPILGWIPGNIIKVPELTKTFDKTWTIKAGMRYWVENREIKSELQVISVESDWPSGILGVLVGVIDEQFRILGFLAEGKDLGRLSDFVVLLGGFVGSALAKNQINATFDGLNRLNQSDVLYLKEIRFDSRGIWHIFKYDLSDVNAVSDFLTTYFPNLPPVIKTLLALIRQAANGETVILTDPVYKTESILDFGGKSITVRSANGRAVLITPENRGKLTITNVGGGITRIEAGVNGTITIR
jgi:hypothetical protein